MLCVIPTSYNFSSHSSTVVRRLHNDDPKFLRVGDILVFHGKIIFVAFNSARRRFLAYLNILGIKDFAPIKAAPFLHLNQQGKTNQWIRSFLVMMINTLSSIDFSHFLSMRVMQNPRGRSLSFHSWNKFHDEKSNRLSLPSSRIYRGGSYALLLLAGHPWNKRRDNNFHDCCSGKNRISQKKFVEVHSLCSSFLFCLFCFLRLQVCSTLKNTVQYSPVVSDIVVFYCCSDEE